MTQKYQVKLSMNQSAIVKTGLVLKQGDFGMQIEIEVLDFNVSGTTPQIVFRKPIGAVESTTITVSSNKYTYTFQGTELDTPGRVICDLKLKNSTTQRISSASFQFDVIADTMDGLEEQASSYSDTIETLFESVPHLENKYTSISSASDLNSYTTPGNYYISDTAYANCTNIPTANLRNVRLFVFKNSGVRTVQIIMGISTRWNSQYIASRVVYNNAWSAWLQINNNNLAIVNDSYSTLASFLNSASYGTYYKNATTEFLAGTNILSGICNITKEYLTDARDIATVYRYSANGANVLSVYVAMSDTSKSFVNAKWRLAYRCVNATTYIATNADLNNCTEPGDYICPSYETASTISNAPIYRAFKLTVESINQEDRIMQTVKTAFVNMEFTRAGYASTSGGVTTWTFTEWCRQFTMRDITNISEGGTEARTRDGLVLRSEIQSELIRHCKHIALKALEFNNFKMTYYNSYDGPTSKHIWDRMANCSIFVGDVYALKGYGALYPSHSYSVTPYSELDPHDVMVQGDDRTLASIQAKMGELIDYTDVEPGNTFYHSNSPHNYSNITHTGMCLGNGYYIHETRSVSGPARGYFFASNYQDKVKHYCTYDDFDYHKYNFFSSNGKIILKIVGRTKEEFDERTYDESTYQSGMYSNLPTLDNPCGMSDVGENSKITLKVNGSNYDIPIDTLYGIADVADTIESKNGTYKYIRRITKRILSSSDTIQKQTLGSNNIYVFTGIELASETTIHLNSNFAVRRLESEVTNGTDIVGIFRITLDNVKYLAYSSGATELTVDQLKDALDANTCIVYYKSLTDTEENVSSSTLNAILDMPVIAGDNIIEVTSSPEPLLDIQYADSESGALFFDMMQWYYSQQ